MDRVTIQSWCKVVLAAFLVLGASPRLSDEENIQLGKKVYERSCAVCHGISGKGDGPAAFFNSAYTGPRPRDFTVGNYKYRSTESGEFPTDEDMLRIISRGIPGLMPAFHGLSESARRQVITYLKTLTPGMKHSSAKAVLLPRPSIPPTSASVARGREVYVALDCQSCHGEEGDGQGDVRKDLVDERGMPSRATDFRYVDEFRNGSTPEDVIRSLWTGLDGTPMPSYAVQFEGQEADAWHLVNYILSLSHKQ